MAVSGDNKHRLTNGNNRNGGTEILPIDPYSGQSRTEFTWHLLRVLVAVCQQMIVIIVWVHSLKCMEG